MTRLDLAGWDLDNRATGTENPLAQLQSQTIYHNSYQKPEALNMHIRMYLH